MAGDWMTDMHEPNIKLTSAEDRSRKYWGLTWQNIVMALSFVFASGVAWKGLSTTQDANEVVNKAQDARMEVQERDISDIRTRINETHDAVMNTQGDVRLLLERTKPK